ncbi:MAG: hypothetical protein LUH82_00250 [Clostridiales bacterium]|nr:hypothetical protein [Clostridiales bacterium]
MDYIKSWTFCICTTLISAVIFSFLAPRGTLGRFYKVIVSIFIFLSFLYPLSEFDAGELSADFDFEYEYSDAVSSAAALEVKALIENALEDGGVNYSVVEVETSLSGEEVIIEKVKISVTDEYSAEDVEKMIFDKLGIAAEVKRIGE